MKPSPSGARPCGRGLFGTLTVMAVAATLALLPACTEEDLERILETCPTDPADQGGIDWTPDVGAPVFYGHQDLTPADGAPRDLRVFYPSVDGSPPDAPMLRRCLVRWPVVLFLHGQPPQLNGTHSYHLRWAHLPAVLARSGYVVVVPSLSSQQIITDPEAARDAALADLDWVRSGWSEATWVNQQATAVAGHSLGGVLASFVAAARPDMQAMVTLSGDFLNGGRLGQVEAPSFFMWAHDLLSEDLDLLGTWNQLSMPRYKAVFPGEHFDYLRESDVHDSTPRGRCDLIGPVAADLAALFLSIHLPVPLGRNPAPVDLQPPSVQLTDDQRFFAGGHLSGLGQFPDSSGCQLDLAWDLDGTTGQRQIGGS
jgi:predicted dienelactone hydrolase